MRRMKKKLRSSGGLTLVEALCAVVVLILLSLLLNTGLQMAVKSYHDITAESEAQLLLSTLSDALGDKLRYTTVTVDESGAFVSASIGEVTVSGGKVLVGGNRLLPDGAYGNGKYRVDDADSAKDLGYDADGNCFTLDLKVKETSGTISAEATLAVRCLNPPKKEGTTP